MDEQPVAMERSPSTEPIAAEHGPSESDTAKFPTSERLGKISAIVKRKKKKRRRRRGRTVNSNVHSEDKDMFSVYHSNVRSVHSKLSSINAIVAALNPSVITLNETNLKGKKKLKVMGYKSFSRNRENGNMGGVATAIVDKLASK